MNDAYFIVVTVIFGVFVLAMIYFLYRMFRPLRVSEINPDKLSEADKDHLYKICGEFRRSRQVSQIKSQTKSNK